MGPDNDLATRSAVALADLVRSGQASALEVTDAVLARIDRVGGPLNAFVVLDPELARGQAREADAQRARGGPLGALHGVPVTIKDVQAVTGWPTRRGSQVTDPTPAAADAPAVAKLRAAGAIIIGKTTSTEHGWTATSMNPLTGATHNPWRHGVTSGGSSSGAAALAAAGCGPLHLGTDGAGSVRLPSHFCGVVGHKPTYGRVPYGPVPNNSHLSHIGPITRDVRDAALMLQVMSGPHEADPVSLPIAFDAADVTSSAVKGLRVAFSPTLGHAKVDPEVAALVAKAARDLAALGAHVEEIDPPWGPQGPEIIRPLWLAAMRITRPSDPALLAKVDPGLQACMEEAGALSLDDLVRTQGLRWAYAASVAQWLAARFDLLVTPSASVAAFDVNLLRPAHWPQHPWNWLVWAEFSYPFNLSHLPAITVPCGLTADGLPVGVQIVGPRFADARVMRAAQAYRAAQPAIGQHLLK